MKTVQTYAVKWLPIAGSADMVSACGKYVARYKYTANTNVGCFPVYWTYCSDEKRQKSMKSALTVGGLPQFLTGAWC